MSHKIFSAAVILAVAATPSFSQSLNGATISGNVNVFDDDSYDATNSALKAGAELGLSRDFAISGNLAVYNSDEVDETGTNVTLHGLYMISPTTALGVYVASDDDGGANYEHFGVEAGFGSPQGRFEFYYGAVDGLSDSSSIDTSIAGISFEFEVARNFALMLNSQAVTFSDDFNDSVTLGTTAIGGRYTFDNGPSIYAEIGQLGATASIDGDLFVSENDSNFFAIGAEMTFGRSSGTLMSNRSVFEAIGY